MAERTKILASNEAITTLYLIPPDEAVGARVHWLTEDIWQTYCLAHQEQIKPPQGADLTRVKVEPLKFGSVLGMPKMELWCQACPVGTDAESESVLNQLRVRVMQAKARAHEADEADGRLKSGASSSGWTSSV